MTSRSRTHSFPSPSGRGVKTSWRVLRGLPDRLQQVGQRHYAPMQGQELVDYQLEPFDIVVQIHLRRMGLRWRWRIGRRWVIDIGLNQELLFGEVGHEEPIVVYVALDVMQLYRPCVITQDTFILHALHRRLLP